LNQHENLKITEWKNPAARRMSIATSAPDAPDAIIVAETG